VAALSRDLPCVPIAGVSVRGPRGLSDHEGLRSSDRGSSLLPTDDVPHWPDPPTMAHDSLGEARHLTTACSRRASRAADAER